MVRQSCPPVPRLPALTVRWVARPVSRENGWDRACLDVAGTGYMAESWYAGDDGGWWQLVTLTPLSGGSPETITFGPDGALGDPFLAAAVAKALEVLETFECRSREFKAVCEVMDKGASFDGWGVRS